MLIQTNRYQTPVTQELLDSLPNEVAEQLMDCLTNIQFIKNLISRRNRLTTSVIKDGDRKVMSSLFTFVPD